MKVQNILRCVLKFEIQYSNKTAENVTLQLSDYKRILQTQLELRFKT